MWRDVKIRQRVGGEMVEENAEEKIGEVEGKKGGGRSLKRLLGPHMFFSEEYWANILEI